jgi:hypothetical protein
MVVEPVRLRFRLTETGGFLSIDRSAVTVPTLDRLTAIHCCLLAALLAGCAELPTHGRLGDGTEENRDVPTPVSGWSALP